MGKLIIVNGTMGVGKTSVCEKLNETLSNSVFLDGDWCWKMSPFTVTDETKKMVINNISFLLNSYINCSAFEHIVFCWVLHKDTIIEELISRLDQSDCELHVITLVCSEESLRSRMQNDVEMQLRDEGSIERSIERLPLYHLMDTQKIDVSALSVDMTVEKIERIIRSK
jgi:cytidylate kinase